MSEQFAEFGGSLTADALTFNTDAIPAPDTLCIRMTRYERRIADELRKEFGGFKRVVIDVDGERHEFEADSLIQMLEEYEDVQGMNKHMALFGTPERAARTITQMQMATDLMGCCDASTCPAAFDECWKLDACPMDEYDPLLEWLRGDA